MPTAVLIPSLVVQASRLSPFRRLPRSDRSSFPMCGPHLRRRPRPSQWQRRSRRRSRHRPDESGFGAAGGTGVPRLGACWPARNASGDGCGRHGGRVPAPRVAGRHGDDCRRSTGPAAERRGDRSDLRQRRLGHRSPGAGAAIDGRSAEPNGSEARPVAVRRRRESRSRGCLTSPLVVRPWVGGSDARQWELPESAALDDLVDDARAVAPPCPALVGIGRDDDGAECYLDLEAVGTLSVAPWRLHDDPGHARGDPAGGTRSEWWWSARTRQACGVATRFVECPTWLLPSRRPRHSPRRLCACPTVLPRRSVSELWPATRHGSRSWWSCLNPSPTPPISPAFGG